jgi:hypothetical protein
VAPGVFAIAGVFLWHFGFLAAATIYVCSLIGGSLNAMRPALLEQKGHTTLSTAKHPLLTSPKLGEVRRGWEG